MWCKDLLQKIHCKWEMWSTCKMSCFAQEAGVVRDKIYHVMTLKREELVGNFPSIKCLQPMASCACAKQRISGESSEMDESGRAPQSLM